MTSGYFVSQHPGEDSWLDYDSTSVLNHPSALSLTLNVKSSRKLQEADFCWC